MSGQLVHAGFFSKLKDVRVKAFYFRRIKLRFCIGCEQLFNPLSGTPECIQSTGLFPATDRVSVDDRAGHMLFFPKELERDPLLEEIAAFEIDPFIKTGGKGICMNLHAVNHAFGHGNAFGIDHQFLRALTEE